MESLHPCVPLEALCSAQLDTVTHTALVKSLQPSQEGKLHIFKYSKKQLKAIVKSQMKDTDSKGRNSVGWRVRESFVGEVRFLMYLAAYRWIDCWRNKELTVCR